MFVPAMPVPSGPRLATPKHAEDMVKPDRARVLAEGLVTGLVGYLVVVLFYGFLNLFTGRGFFRTAELLGRGLVGGGDAAPGAAGAVYAFNGVHLVAFLVIGLAAAWLVMQTERHPSFFVVALFVALAGFFATLVVWVPASARFAAELSLGSIVAANLLAGVGMGVSLVRSHPRLWSKIRDHLDPETQHPAPH